MNTTSNTPDEQPARTSQLGEADGQDDATKSCPHSAAPCTETDSQAATAQEPRAAVDWSGGFYQPKIRRERKSVFTGGETVVDEIDPMSPDMPPLVKAFAADHDIQQMDICSANIGFIWKLSKQYVAREKPPLGKRKATATTDSATRGADAPGPKLPSA